MHGGPPVRFLTSAVARVSMRHNARGWHSQVLRAALPHGRALLPDGRAPMPHRRAPMPDARAPMHPRPARMPQEPAPVPHGRAQMPHGRTPVPGRWASMPVRRAPMPAQRAPLQVECAKPVLHRQVFENNLKQSSLRRSTVNSCRRPSFLSQSQTSTHIKKH